MDKQLLVNQAIEKLNQKLISQGYKVGESRTISRYVGFRPFPVEVGFVMPDVQRDSRHKMARDLGQLKRTLLTDEEQTLIGVFLIYPTAEDMNEDMDERLGLTTVVGDW
jgi:hypothetical protein